MKTYTAIRRKHWRLCHREQREGVRFVISRSLAYSFFEDKYSIIRYVRGTVLWHVLYSMEEMGVAYRGQTPLSSLISEHNNTMEK